MSIYYNQDFYKLRYSRFQPNTSVLTIP